MATTLHFATLSSLKDAITAARQAAKNEARRDCGRGFLLSRGAFIWVYADDNVIKGEGDEWEWKGTAAQMRELAALADDPKTQRIVIRGGWNFTESLREYVEYGTYDPWVSEWEVRFAHRAGE